MARRLLIGESLAHFEKKAETFVETDGEGNKTTCEETLDNFELALQAVTMTVFPKKSLTTQKRYMRRIMRKPRDMKTRDYCARYAEINKYLEEFPLFKGKQQVLPEDEILEHQFQTAGRRKWYCRVLTPLREAPKTLLSSARDWNSVRKFMTPVMCARRQMSRMTLIRMLA